MSPDKDPSDSLGWLTGDDIVIINLPSALSSHIVDLLSLPCPVSVEPLILVKKRNDL